MKERHVYTLSLALCLIGLIIAIYTLNGLAIIGFGLAVIANFSSRWFFVRWVRAGKPENNNSFF